MPTILAYTSPAVGHLFPMSALLSELARRGHRIVLRTLTAGVQTGHELGFETKAIDPRIEAVVLDDWVERTPKAALQRAFDVFARRADYEVEDLREAIDEVRPDCLLIDANCWGAVAVAETSGLPWASFWPYIPYLRSRGVPPFGPGLPPMTGPVGRLRDSLLRPVVTGTLEKSMLPSLNRVRATVAAPAVRSVDESLRRPPLMLVATGEPFEYPRPDRGDAVHLIGDCSFDPAPSAPPDWLDSIDAPIVLVSTSSERQEDTGLVRTAFEALADEPVHVVATLPAGIPAGLAVPANATVREFVPHSQVLDRAACAITHGGMGATQKALARGVPVCVVPHGRDQFEVARRVEVARCGTRLPAKQLTVPRLRQKVRQAMAMADGAQRVAAGFAATGGVAQGAALVEQRLLRGAPKRNSWS